MSDTSHDHEMVSIYGYTDDQIDSLLTQASECVLMWGTKDGWPVGVVHAFVWHEGKIWITFATHRHRASAIRRDNRVSVAISAVANTNMGGAATCKGHATFHDDDATKAWFYPALAKKVSPDSAEGEAAFHSLLDSPLRTIISVDPVKWITYDGEKANRDMTGDLKDDEKTPRKEADAVRMNKVREEMGLPPR